MVSHHKIPIYENLTYSLGRNNILACLLAEYPYYATYQLASDCHLLIHNYKSDIVVGFVDETKSTDI